MKNFIYYFAILVCCASCQSNKTGTTKDSSATSATASRRATVASSDPTNISEKEAEDLVSRFRNNNGVYSDSTSSWFSKDLILALDDALDITKHKTNLDGVRIYLGLRENGKHTFLAVLTEKNGVYTSDSCGKKIQMESHKDMFGTPVAGYKLPVYVAIDDNKDSGAKLGHQGCCSANNSLVFVDQYKIHDVPCDTASIWARNGKNGKDTINTYSEWFESAFIHDLAEELKTTDSNKDGIRIYLARKVTVDCSKQKRHVFLIVTTNAMAPTGTNGGHMDDYTSRSEMKKLLHKRKHLYSIEDNGEQCLNNCNGATLQ